MPRVSRRPVNKDLDQELRENFISLISNLNASKDIEGFFGSFLTKEEKIMLGKRLLLHLMLESGFKTSQIEAILKMSRETVRIHKIIWENGDTSYKNVLRKILRQQKIKDFFKKLDKVFRPLEISIKAQSNMQARAKLARGDFS